jgi:hypothetical protein
MLCHHLARRCHVGGAICFFGVVKDRSVPKKSSGKACMEFLRRFAPYSQGVAKFASELGPSN